MEYLTVVVVGMEVVEVAVGVALLIVLLQRQLEGLALRVMLEVQVILAILVGLVIQEVEEGLEAQGLLVQILLEVQLVVQVY